MTNNSKLSKIFLAITIFLEVLSQCNGNNIDPKKKHFFKTKHSSRSAQNNAERDESEMEDVGDLPYLPLISSDQVSSLAVKGRPIEEKENVSKIEESSNMENALQETKLVTPNTKR